MTTGHEYRYSPGQPPGPCPEHPGCLLVRCACLFCDRLIHLPLNRPGQPRRYCTTACRVAEHRRLTM